MKLLLCLALVATGLLCGCAPPVSSSPERVVESMYEALGEADTDAYLDAILPENRKQPNMMGLLSAFSLNIGPVGLDLGKLTGFSVRDLEFEELVRENDYALVRVRGNMRYPILMMEVPFCDEHDVRLIDGAWYVDVYAPERAGRLERVLGIRQQELEQLSSDAEYQTLMGALGLSMEKTLDLCER